MATNFQDMVAKVKNLVALVPVLGAISRPGGRKEKGKGELFDLMAQGTGPIFGGG